MTDSPRKSYEDLMKNPAIARAVAQVEMSETFYKRLEELFPCPPMSDEMLAFMNERMGFSTYSTKDRDYRPYCGNDHCTTAPRMFRVKEGFKCWKCHRVWDIKKQMEEQNDNPTAES